MKDNAQSKRAFNSNLIIQLRKGMRQPTSELTARQVQILTELEKGKLYKEKSEELGISMGTMKQHVHKILTKLDANNRTEVVLKWYKNQNV